MIIEALVSTLGPDGRPNFAPMGVQWDETAPTLRPFRTSHTCRNLLATGYAVVSVTDDVGAFVDSALGDAALPHFPAQVVPGVVFAGACYWRELRLVSAGGPPERAELRCRVVHRGWQRDFLGYNRARNAVIEAAVLATRLHLLDRDEVLAALDRFAVIVSKTGDAAERAALQRIQQTIKDWQDEGTR